MADNKTIAKNVFALVGGKENIIDVTNCMTRLRFHLKDESIVNDEDVKGTDGVLGVVHGGGQYQIVIGPNVKKVCEEVCVLGGFAKQAEVKEDTSDVPDNTVKQKLTPKQVGKNIMGYMAGCMTPMIPVLLAGGMFRAFNSILGPGMLGLYAETSSLYILFDFLYDATLYFMPILVGVNAAKQLGISTMLGGYVGAVLMAPDFVAMVAEGTPFSIIGIPVTMTDYAQTVLPVMISVYAFSLIYKVVDKYMPDLITTIFTPFVSCLISAPIILCLLAPLGSIIGNAISGGLAWFGLHTGFVGIAIISALWEFLVMTGMHLALMMPMMASFFETGVMTGPANAGCFATWACFGVALGAALRLKDKSSKSTAFGAFASGILGGVTEPTLYGICFRYTNCFIGLIAGGFIGGAYAGITNVCQYAMSSANLLSLVGFTGGSTVNLVNGIIACMLSLISAAVVTYMFGFKKKDMAKGA